VMSAAHAGVVTMASSQALVRSADHPPTAEFGCQAGSPREVGGSEVRI
jgi:hypothetical protein